MIDWIAAALLASGGFFCFVAGVGIVRLGDIFIRMHASTKAGTLGIALIALALVALSGDWLEILEPLFVFLFMIATIPIGSHLIGRAAFRTGIAMQEDTRADAGCGTFRGPEQIKPQPAGQG
ncbi:monovalent cation/H(+) antiporter subunit G [soil metagenome]